MRDTGYCVIRIDNRKSKETEMIKNKQAVCKDCPPGTLPGPVTAGRCNTHYWAYRNKVNAEKRANKDKKAVKGIVGAYMASQTIKRPDFCEESGQPLPKSGFMRKACVAHILPKRPDHGFPSVAIHPMNKIFLHPDIHANMDNLGKEYILKMKSLPLMRQRVKALLPFLTEDELNRVPEYFILNT